MSVSRISRKYLFKCAVAMAATFTTSSYAQGISEEQMLKALSPEAALRTRSLTIGPPTTAPTPISSEDEALVDSIRNKQARPLSTIERESLVEAASTKPQIDLPIEFAYNSATIEGDDLVIADRLGKTLTSPSLSNQTFMIAGHTDAKGSDEINQKLSERRAEAVKMYLIKKYHLQASNLITVGYGKSRLKNLSDPNARENRRVQVVNMLQKPARAATR